MNVVPFVGSEDALSVRQPVHRGSLMLDHAADVSLEEIRAELRKREGLLAQLQKHEFEAVSLCVKCLWHINAQQQRMGRIKAANREMELQLAAAQARLRYLEAANAARTTKGVDNLMLSHDATLRALQDERSAAVAALDTANTKLQACTVETRKLSADLRAATERIKILELALSRKETEMAEWRRRRQTEREEDDREWEELERTVDTELRARDAHIAQLRGEADALRRRVSDLEGERRKSVVSSPSPPDSPSLLPPSSPLPPPPLVLIPPTEQRPPILGSLLKSAHASPSASAPEQSSPIALAPFFSENAPHPAGSSPNQASSSAALAGPSISGEGRLLLAGSPRQRPSSPLTNESASSLPSLAWPLAQALVTRQIEGAGSGASDIGVAVDALIRHSTGDQRRPARTARDQLAHEVREQQKKQALQAAVTSQIFEYLHFGCAINRVSDKGVQKVFAFLAADHKMLVTCGFDSRNAPLRENVLESIKLSHVEQFILGASTETFRKAVGEKKSRRGSLSSGGKSKEKKRDRSPVRARIRRELEAHRQWCFSLVLRDKHTVDLVALSATDFEAWTTAMARVLNAKPSFADGNRAIEDSSEYRALTEEERQLCRQLHIHPSELRKSAELLLDPRRFYLTAYDIRVHTTLPLLHCEQLFSLWLQQGKLHRVEVFVVDANAAPITDELDKGKGVESPEGVDNEGDESPPAPPARIRSVMWHDGWNEDERGTPQQPGNKDRYSFILSEWDSSDQSSLKYKAAKSKRKAAKEAALLEKRVNNESFSTFGPVTGSPESSPRSSPLAAPVKA